MKANDYNLPKIKVNKKTSKIDSKSYREKYLKIYIKLIDKFKQSKSMGTTGNVYCEAHHILPKCLGGSDLEENIVNLPVRYHIMAHYLLTVIYPEVNCLKLALALFVNGGSGNKPQEQRSFAIKTFSTRTISTMREEAHNALLNRSDEELVNIREAGDRKINKRLINGHFVFTDKLEDRLLIKTPEMTYPRNPQSHPKNLATVGTGRKHTEESKRKISEARRKKNSSESYIGGRNSRAKKVIGPDGQIFDCIQYAANFANVNRTTMRKWLNNKGMSSNGNHGYSFL